MTTRGPVTLEERRRVLEARARLLAREAAAPESDAGSLEVIEFSVGHEKYAVEARHVREIHPLKELTPLPCTPRHFLGIVNVRGEICPVVDLRRLFGMEERGIANATRAVIVRQGALELGIAADAVVGVRALSQTQIAEAPATIAGLHREMLRGVTEDGLIVLDALRLLAHPSIIVREEVGEVH